MKKYITPPINPEWKELPLEKQLEAAEAVSNCLADGGLHRTLEVMICGTRQTDSHISRITGLDGTIAGIKDTCRGVECYDCVAGRLEHVEVALETNQLKLTEIFNYDDLDS